MKKVFYSGGFLVATALLFLILTSMKMTHTETAGAYLEITLEVRPENRSSAGAVYAKYKAPFLNKIDGALTKRLVDQK